MSLDRHIAVIGLGYVGLPVAVAFGQKQLVIGYDKSDSRIEELISGHDRTGEVKSQALKSTNITFTTDEEHLKQADFYIVAVPTPIDKAKQPDLSLLVDATSVVAEQLSKGDIVVYESTVYPGVTEEVCIPILEELSGLKLGDGFKVGYSPERINPGDKEHTFTNITKIVSGSDSEALKIISTVYQSVIKPAVYEAVSIKVAEAAKVIENTQRDLNIALINELALIFHRMNIDTQAVLSAANTKWNFLNFKPGLVGGHCIGVDPYYLTYRAEQLGYNPEVILAGRRINDNMGKFIAEQTILHMVHAGCQIKNANVTILGLTFKENCNDIRNSRVPDIITTLEDYGINTSIYDPLVNPDSAKKSYGITLADWESIKKTDAIILAVAHDEFKKIPLKDLADKLTNGKVLVDIKGIVNPESAKKEKITLWRL